MDFATHQMFGSAILIGACPARANFTMFKNLHACVSVHVMTKHVLKIRNKTAGPKSQGVFVKYALARSYAPSPNQGVIAAKLITAFLRLPLGITNVARSV